MSVISAEQFVKENITSSDKFDFKNKVELVKKFANLHREAILKEVCKKVECSVYSDFGYEIDKSSILNAYPEKFIK